MTASELRQAASLMRERAQAIPPEGLSDWWFGDEASDLMHLRQHDRVQIATFGHPAVALAVADWLDAQAADLDSVDAKVGWVTAEWTAANERALAVARAFLGTTP